MSWVVVGRYVPSSCMISIFPLYILFQIDDRVVLCLISCVSQNDCWIIVGFSQQDWSSLFLLETTVLGQGPIRWNRKFYYGNPRRITGSQQFLILDSLSYRSHRSPESYRPLEYGPMDLQNKIILNSIWTNSIFRSSIFQISAGCGPLS